MPNGKPLSVPERCGVAPFRRDPLPSLRWPGVRRLGDRPDGYREKRAFNVYTVATSGKPLTSQRFLKVVPGYTIDNAPRPDVIVIPGGGTGVLLDDERFMAWAVKTSRQAEMTLTVCTGAFVPARAGLLDGATATTWYGAIERLRLTWPRNTAT